MTTTRTAAALPIATKPAGCALMFFGKPQAGTPSMPCAQGAGIELPLKALAAIAEATVAT